MKSFLASIKRTAARVVGVKEPERVAERRVLFVCMGNICRSPTAEGVLRKQLAERAPELDVQVDSAGTHGFHTGEPPDPRACRAAERRGVDLKALRARQVTLRDFQHFELVLAMDERTRALLLAACPVEYHGRIKLFLDFAPQLAGRDVPDPYYGGSAGFELVLDLVEEATAGLIEHLKRTPPPRPETGANGSAD